MFIKSRAIVGVEGNNKLAITRITVNKGFIIPNSIRHYNTSYFIYEKVVFN
jgi:hypothetical protein